MLRTNTRESPDPQLAGIPRPGDYELGSAESRAAARAHLDAKLKTDQRKRFRVTLATIGMSFNLETSSCACSLWPDGTLFENVRLVGAHPTEEQREQLEAFICKVPIDGKDHTFAEMGHGQ